MIRDHDMTLSQQVIYDLLDYVNELIAEHAPRRYESIEVGAAVVQKVFNLTGSRKGIVAGCKVDSGLLGRPYTYEIIRKGTTIHSGKVNALRHLQNDVDSVAAGQECGISFKDFEDIQEGDTIKCFEEVEI